MKAKYGKQLIGVICITILGGILFGIHTSFYQEPVETVNQVEEVVIPVIFLCDEATQNKSNANLIQEFNAINKGKYRIDVEWFTGNAAAYRARIKMLNSIDELPAIITDIGFDPAFYKLLVDNKQIINLAPYFINDLEWTKCFDKGVIDSVKEADGSLYMMPLNTTYYSGIFWNKELFAKAGIESFPKTWEDFWKVCDQLQAAGITPLSLHTEGTSWASMLPATSSLGQDEEGSQFIKEVFPDTYDVPVFYRLLDVYKKAFEYTTEDAIGNNFDVAEKHFYLEETAMIPNGRWMIESFKDNQYAAERFEEKISFAAFPENVLIGSTAMSGWAVSSNYDKKVQQGAIEFLKFRNLKDYSDTKDMDDPSIYSLYELPLKDYFKVLKEPFTLIPNYQLKWNTLIQNDIFSTYLPELLNNDITEKQFVSRLDEAVEIYNLERIVDEEGEG